MKRKKKQRGEERVTRKTGRTVMEVPLRRRRKEEGDRERDNNCIHCQRGIMPMMIMVEKMMMMERVMM